MNDNTNNPNDKNWSRIWRDFWITVGFNVGANLIGLIVIFYHQIEDKFTAILWALACLISGGMIGFLFGIPRVLQDTNAPVGIQKNSVQENDSTQTSQPYYRMQVNTNLEQISDWLTKIIVGVGLIELRRLPEALNSLSMFLARGVNELPQTQVLASVIIVYFTIAGFLGAYLMTRIYLAQAFSRADWGTQNTVIIGGQKLTTEEIIEQQRRQITDIQEQVIKGQAEAENPTTNKTVDESLVSEGKYKVRSILWVDDNPKNNGLHVQGLNELGIEVVLSLSTADALRKLESGTFDRIISDMGRQEENVYNEKAGLTLLKAIKGRAITTPFLIFCATKLVKDYREEAMKEGAATITSSSIELMRSLQL